MRHVIATLILAVSLSALGGCGQTGPLYLPDDGTLPAEPRVQSEPAETPLP